MDLTNVLELADIRFVTAYLVFWFNKGQVFKDKRHVVSYICPWTFYNISVHSCGVALVTCFMMYITY